MTTRLALSIFIVLLGSSAAFAETTFQFNLAGLQAPSDPDVRGMRMVLLYGKNTNDVKKWAPDNTGSMSGPQVCPYRSKLTCSKYRGL